MIAISNTKRPLLAHGALVNNWVRYADSLEFELDIRTKAYELVHEVLTDDINEAGYDAALRLKRELREAQENVERAYQHCKSAEKELDDAYNVAAEQQHEIAWRKRAMGDARDALASGDNDAAWCALHRHEDNHQCSVCDPELADQREVTD